MDRLVSCEFNMDTACVELKFFDGSIIAIDTIAVEKEVADNMYQRSELDYLIYNDPIGYADLILNPSFGKKMTILKPFPHWEVASRRRFRSSAIFLTR